ncbi:MAG: hypothetical protein IJ960_06510 [Oscillospiraceae bacterium]|nr:hypothetical protein [Oscillospiraceae bacterium]
MEVKKQTQALGGGVPTAQQLGAINAQAKAELKAEEVYVFSLRLCDDQVDRDHERFDTEALPELARMFVGKSGIVDHQWSAKQQVARIFEAGVVTEAGVSYIKAWAYIRRGGAGDEWIADIEAGIKKEVSVGCAMGRSVCSVCGLEYGTCGHQKGNVYDGQSCVAVLKEPVDAYEFSFVAVPAQANAGVLKGMGTGKASLKELADRFGAQEEYRNLYKQAALGQEYAGLLADQTVRLCLALELGLEEKLLRQMTGKLGTAELKALCRALSEKADRKFPARVQIAASEEAGDWDTGYLI